MSGTASLEEDQGGLRVWGLGFRASVRLMDSGCLGFRVYGRGVRPPKN